MLISPLAAKLCKSKGVDPATLVGSGPRGRIMAADVRTDAKPPRRKGETVMGRFSRKPTRPAKDGYYVYDGVVDMSSLAAISLPIAVQCEKLLEKRYSLFDYITRAVVKACMSVDSWHADKEGIDLLRFDSKGEHTAAIRGVAGKSIYKLAREAAADTLPESFRPHIVVCDSETRRDQVAAYVANGRLPHFAFVVRGGSPKIGVRMGGDDASIYHLEYTFYAAETMPDKDADAIAACLEAMLLDPVRLLLLS